MNIKLYLRAKKYPRFLRRKVSLIQEETRGRRDMKRLQNEFPNLRDFDELLNESRRVLQPYYEDYISNVSTDDMAISLELAAFLAVICDVFKPRRILDLGSGFSSLVFRLYASSSTEKPEVWSVDDSPKWLEETRKYLEAHGFTTEKLITWRSFASQTHGTFDLISHDMGNTDLRAQTLEKVLALASPGGKIVLDDAHKPHYNSYARRILNKLKLEYYSLKSLTEDKFGRYSILVTI